MTAPSTLLKADVVADALREDIFAGRYREGDRLPSERDLAARFGTTRGAVREALRCLEQLGIAAVQPGGARVLPLEHASPDIIGHLLATPGTDTTELLDQLLSVMGSLMGLAVQETLKRASAEQLDQLVAQAQAVLDAPDPASQIPARLDLGQALMHASGNLVLRLVANSLRLQLSNELHEQVQAALPPAPASMMRDLIRALNARDAVAATKVMRLGFAFNREALRAHLATRTTKSAALAVINTKDS